MKKALLVLTAFLFLTISQASAYNLSDFSNDAKIISAMSLLERCGESGVFANLEKNRIKISFEDLSSIGAGQRVYAANTYNKYGRRVILINSAYKNAPAEQIACLIAHESCHVARKATLDEETTATEKEANCWLKLKNDSIDYPDSRLTRRLDKLAGLSIASTQNTNYIKNKIASNSFYRTQLGLN